MAEEEELKIPVFTVLKNGAILKNIFVVNRQSALDDTDGATDGVNEEVLNVGRHPDCHIVLTHPSVSRFHLQIFSNPLLQKLSVMDLSSVHGTWVSDIKIEPGVRVELNEGDTLRVGGSSRVYRLHWVPLNQAYNLEQPFFTAMDVSMVEEREGESVKIEERITDEAYQIEHGEFGEYKNLLEELNDEGVIAISEDELEGAKVEEEIVEAYQDLLKIETGESKDPLDRDQDILGIHENVIEYAKLEGNITEAYNDDLLKIYDGEFEAQKDPSEKIAKEVPAIGVVMEASQEGSEPSKEIQSLNMTLEGLSSLILDEHCGLLVRDETPTRLPLPQKMDSSSAVELREISSEINLKRGGDCTACPGFAFSECMSFSLPPGVLFDTVVPVPDKEEDNWKVGMSPEYSRDGVENDSRISQNEDFRNFSVVKTLEEDDSSSSIWYLENQNEAANTLSQCSKSILPESAHLFLPDVLEDTAEQMDAENLTPLVYIPAESELVSEIGKSGNSTKKQTGNFFETVDTIWSAENQIHSAPNAHESESQNVRAEDNEERDALNSQLENSATESVNPCFSGQNILSDVNSRHYNEENQTMQLQFSVDRMSCTESDTPSIWSRRGRPAAVLQLQTGRKSRKSRSTGFNSENRHQIKENAENKFVVRDLFAELDREEEEIFTPDKENMTPNTRKLKFMKDIGKVGVVPLGPLGLSSSKVYFNPTNSQESTFQSFDTENPTSVKKNSGPNTPPFRSIPSQIEEGNKSKSFWGSTSKAFLSPNFCPEEDVFHSSDKENQTPQVLKEHKRVKPASRSRSRLVKEISEVKGRERLPFQSLHLKSENISESSGGGGAISSRNSIKSKREVEREDVSIIPKVAESKKTWIMITDTSSFVDKESWKALQLLQGLPGTQLVIPRMVIRELDSLKRTFSLFRRTAAASSVLEWIEETMVNTNWWIHIQNSADEGGLIVPTPPASPHCVTRGDFPTALTCSCRFSSIGNFIEVASPTAEDHILEYALYFRKTKTNGQIVLLSNDISLKIKAMAEGLLCETPQEFRASLVNPFSERFMWAESYPRGRTWSGLDDVVLKEKYCRQLLKKPSRGDGAKGLKLILLHNSNYRQINSFS